MNTMKYFGFMILTLVLFNCKQDKKVPVKDVSVAQFFVGTYTQDRPYEEGGSQGIYLYEIDAQGKLTQVGLAAQSDNPSFLTISSDGKYLIAVNEINSADHKGTVESYKIESNKLTKLSTSSSGGAHPCYVASNKVGQVIVANYTSGNVSLLNISKNGTLSELLDVQQHIGEGTTDRQEGPHAHSCWFRPDGGVVSVDLGTNELWFSTIENNKFIPSSPYKLAMQDGAGPRHLTFHPNGKFVYILNELDNTIGLATVQSEGTYTKKSTISTLPNDFHEFSKAADIHISDDGQFIYATNRGHNSIAIFSVNQADGILTLLAHESTRGDGPRNFKITPNSNFIVLANQNDNNIISYKRNVTTGLLTFIDEVFAPMPVCLEF